MQTILCVVFSIYLTVMFCHAFNSWIHSKNNREYGVRLINTVISGGMIFAFIKLLDFVEGVA